MRYLRWLVLGLLLCPGGVFAADMRCEGRLVGVGDTVVELRAKCGAPAFRRSQPRLSAVGTPDDLSYVREQVEIWTYPNQPNGLGRVVTVRRGRVASIETLGKLALNRNPACARRSFSKGTRVGTVRLSCGAPMDRAVWEEQRVVRTRSGHEVRRLVVHETWTYDPGPGRLIRIIHFENGRLTRTETGHRSPS